MVRGRYIAESDIDIMVVTTNIGRKYEVMAKVYRTIDAPIELHIVTPELYNIWYRRFISENEIIEI